MEAVSSSESLVYNCQTAPLNIAEYSLLHSRRCNNLKSHLNLFSLYVVDKLIIFVLIAQATWGQLRFKRLYPISWYQLWNHTLACREGPWRPPVGTDIFGCFTQLYKLLRSCSIDGSMIVWCICRFVSTSSCGEFQITVSSLCWNIWGKKTFENLWHIYHYSNLNPTT